METNFGISVNPIAAADAIFDFSGNKSRAKRAMANDEKWRIYDARQAAEQWRFQQGVYHQGIKRQDNQLQRLVRDASAAGIHPLAALGAAPQTPMQINMPGRTGGRYQTKPIFTDVSNITSISTQLALQKQVADTAKSTAEAINATSQLTTKPTIRPEKEVEVSQSSRSGDRFPMTAEYMGPGGPVKGPSAEFPDPEQWLLWWIMQNFSNVGSVVRSPSQRHFMRKNPDNQNRFSPDMDIAP